MLSLLLLSIVSASALNLLLFPLRPPSVLPLSDLASQHLRVRLPAEKESLGRNVIADLERCYDFMNRATGDRLPRRILLAIDWNLPNSSSSYRDAAITIGMKQPAAINARTFLMHSAAREIARLGLLGLSQGAERKDNQFLFEGMIEILVHEFDHSSRSLEGAWVISQFLDEMGQLGLAAQRSWPSFSGGRTCLRNAAPGITFLMTFRELQGRDRPLKFFEAVRISSLTESMAIAFRAPASELEDIWLKRVREYRAPEEITVAADEAPQLLRTVIVPEVAQPGSILSVQLFFKDDAGNLLPDGAFVRDRRSGRVLQAQAATEKDADYFIVKLPVDENCPPGLYLYQVTAIDETGNLRRWNGSYRIAPR